MNQHSTQREFWGQFVLAYHERLEVLRGSGLWLREVWADQLIDGDYRVIKDIVFGLELDWNEEKVGEFIVPSYWGNNSL